MFKRNHTDFSSFLIILVLFSCEQRVVLSVIYIAIAYHKPKYYTQSPNKERENKGGRVWQIRVLKVSPLSIVFSGSPYPVQKVGITHLVYVLLHHDRASIDLLL